MKWLKSYNESQKERTDFAYKIRKKLLEFNLNWQEFIYFLEDNGFDVSKLEELNVPSNSFLGKGGFGMVFSYGNDKVIKVTFNKTDYDFARKLIGKSNQHLPNIYDIKSISNKALTMFIIVMERCQPLPLKLKSYINVHAKDINYFFKTEDIEYLTPQENSLKLVYLQYDLGIQFFEILNEIKEIFGENVLEKKPLDIHSPNFMMKGKNLCFIDIFAPLYNPKQQTTKES